MEQKILNKIDLDIRNLFDKKKSDIKLLDELKLKIKNLKKNDLNKKNYFVILKNLGKNKKEIKKNTIKFAKFFGTAIQQNNRGKKIISVKPDIKKLLKFKNESAKKELRYHQTNLGGSIHSDGPQLNMPPKYVLMTCLNQSSEGGESIIVNTKRIFQNLKNKKPEILKILKQNYLFERRGFHKEDKPLFLNKPIFSNNLKDLKFRYLKDYIISAYQLKNKVLNLKKRQAMRQLDRMLNKKKFQKKYKLKMGDMIIINNNILAHGRTGFSINGKKNLREIVRIWLKN